MAAHALQNFETTDVGQSHIEEDQVGRRDFAQLRHDLIAVACAVRHKTFQLEKLAHGARERRNVFHEQHGVRAAGGGLHGLTDLARDTHRVALRFQQGGEAQRFRLQLSGFVLIRLRATRLRIDRPAGEEIDHVERCNLARLAGFHRLDVALLLEIQGNPAQLRLRHVLQMRFDLPEAELSIDEYEQA